MRVKETVIVLGENRVDFTPKGEEQIKGQRVHTVPVTPVTNDESRGYIPASHFVKGDGFPTVEIPGLYEAEYEVTLGKRTRTELVGLRLLGPVSMPKAGDK